MAEAELKTQETQVLKTVLVKETTETVQLNLSIEEAATLYFIVGKFDSRSNISKYTSRIFWTLDKLNRFEVVPLKNDEDIKLNVDINKVIK